MSAVGTPSSRGTAILGGQEVYAPPNTLNGLTVFLTDLIKLAGENRDYLGELVKRVNGPTSLSVAVSPNQAEPVGLVDVLADEVHQLRWLLEDQRELLDTLASRLS